jgi:hypothetical protein
VAEIDLLFVLVPFVEREVDDPGEFEAVAVDQVEFLAGARARIAGKPGELFRVAGSKEAGVARLQAKLHADRLGALLADVLGDRAGALDPVVSSRQKM